MNSGIESLSDGEFRSLLSKVTEEYQELLLFNPSLMGKSNILIYDMIVIRAQISILYERLNDSVNALTKSIVNADKIISDNPDQVIHSYINAVYEFSKRIRNGFELEV